MGNKIYVGNLSWTVRSDGLKAMFEHIGAVTEARVITDKITRRSKGFGFVTFESEEDAQKAVSEMNGKDVEGRPLKVSEAQEMKPRE